MFPGLNPFEAALAARKKFEEPAIARKIIDTLEDQDTSGGSEENDLSPVAGYVDTQSVKQM
jgi:hypothetical protein